MATRARQCGRVLFVARMLLLCAPCLGFTPLLGFFLIGCDGSQGPFAIYWFILFACATTAARSKSLQAAKNCSV